MTTRTHKGVDAQEKQSTRERILDVALDLFVEQGYEGTSLREIAEVMGFTKAALYYHFASKDDLLLALHMRLHEFGDRSLRQLGDVPPSLATWSGLLVDLLDEILAQRQLLLLHQRNHAALNAMQLKHPEHDHANADLGDMIRALLSDPAVAVRDRVRLGAAIGAITSTLTLVGDALDDVPGDELAEELRRVIRDILGPARARPSWRGGRPAGPGRPQVRQRRRGARGR
jgi:AcrR family transcriptional regulator